MVNSVSSSSSERSKKNTADFNQQHGIKGSQGFADGNTATLNNQIGGTSFENLSCENCLEGVYYTHFFIMK